jgi:hypothetical protein
VIVELVIEFIAKLVAELIAKPNLVGLIRDISQCRICCAHLRETRHIVRWVNQALGQGS